MVDFAVRDRQTQFEDAAGRFDSQRFFFGDAVVVDVFRHATNAVAAHLGLAAVGVEHPHAGVGDRGGMNQDQPVGADAFVPIADGDRQPRQIGGEEFLEGVDIDIVIARTVHFGESHEPTSNLQTDHFNLMDRGATPTALRGRANPFDVRRHAHAEPWAWHPATSLIESLRLRTSSGDRTASQSPRQWHPRGRNPILLTCYSRVRSPRKMLRLSALSRGVNSSSPAISPSSEPASMWNLASTSSAK